MAAACEIAATSGAGCCDEPARPATIDCCSDLGDGDQPTMVPTFLLLTGLPAVITPLPPWQWLSDPIQLVPDARPWWPPDPGTRDLLRDLRSIRLLI